MFVFPSALMSIVALGISIVPSFAKMMRAEFKKQKEMEYVKMARDEMSI